MSCTENENGPLVKYILPAVFGGLTLLLAKRWANIQAPHISTTGVSRRRRIVKDPLVKRPITLNSSKVMTQTSNSKRVESAIRKTSTPYLAPEEDSLINMPPGNRRPQRNTRLSPTTTAAGTPPAANDFVKCNFSNAGASMSTLGYELPFAPRHIPFPNIPYDGDLLFEVMMFVFTSLAAGSQFLNLYRTVWWLPHSYTSQTMNFYLIDRHLVLFILVVLSRRLLFCLITAGAEAVTPVKFLPLVVQILRFLVFGIVVGALGWCTYHLIQTHPILSIFYLCYPASVYLLLFGCRLSPLLQVGAGAVSSPHCCAAAAPAVRHEVDELKADFNNRLKQVIFSSVVGAYYSSYVPWCFAQPFLYFDVYRVIRHLALVWLGLFTQHATHCLSARYCDHLHRAALHLGRWVRGGPAPPAALQSAPQPPAAANGAGDKGTNGGQWCHRTLWAAGASVRHGRSLYTAKGCMTAAEPGNEMHARFYSLFHNPSTILCVLLCLQISLVLLQLFLLFNTTEWHHVLALALLLFSNYYTLFKLVRDYLVTWKVYQAEFTIQDKAVLPVS